MKRDIIRTVQTNTETVVDSETGEVLNLSVKRVKVVTNPDEFALIYAGFWDVLLGNPLSKSDIELLAYLIKNYGDGTPFVITSYIKNEISAKTGKISTSYNNSVSSLLKYKLIFRLDNSRTYKLNPRYAFKGNSSDRKQAVIEMADICPTC